MAAEPAAQLSFRSLADQLPRTQPTTANQKKSCPISCCLNKRFGERRSNLSTNSKSHRSHR